MIFLMDFRGDWLARRFQAARRSLGLALDTPYFNAGLMAIDRAQWRRMKITESVIDRLTREPQRYPFLEQDALNATLAGNFAPLSPRYNFMGDFLLLDLEREIAPSVLHFVNAPKPWELAGWKGEARFALRLSRLVCHFALARTRRDAGVAPLAQRQAAPHAGAQTISRKAEGVSRSPGVHRPVAEAADPYARNRRRIGSAGLSRCESEGICNWGKRAAVLGDGTVSASIARLRNLGRLGFLTAATGLAWVAAATAAKADENGIPFWLSGQFQASPRRRRRLAGPQRSFRTSTAEARAETLRSRAAAALRPRPTPSPC